jgi:hypothetical protein
MRIDCALRQLLRRAELRFELDVALPQRLGLLLRVWQLLSRPIALKRLDEPLAELQQQRCDADDSTTRLPPQAALIWFARIRTRRPQLLSQLPLTQEVAQLRPADLIVPPRACPDLTQRGRLERISRWGRLIPKSRGRGWRDGNT